MKKMLAVAGMLLVLFSATGCEYTVADTTNNEAADNNEAAEDARISEIENENIHIITDHKTGVQYIIYREKFMNAGFGGITPRLNADGSLCVVDVGNTTTEEEVFEYDTSEE